MAHQRGAATGSRISIIEPFVPAPTHLDTRFDVVDPAALTVSDLRTVPGAGRPTRWAVGDDPYMQWRAPLDLCLGHYSLVYVEMAASAAIHPAERQMAVRFQFNGQAACGRPPSPCVARRGLSRTGTS